MITRPEKRFAPFIFIICLVLLILGVWSYSQKTNAPSKGASITDFIDCMEAGYPVMESYPRKCRAGNSTYVEEIDDNENVSCTLDALICPDGSAVGRIPPDCEFAACPDTVN